MRPAVKVWAGKSRAIPGKSSAGEPAREMSAVDARMGGLGGVVCIGGGAVAGRGRGGVVIFFGRTIALPDYSADVDYLQYMLYRRDDRRASCK